MTTDQLAQEIAKALKGPIEKFQDAPTSASKELAELEKKHSAKKKELAKVLSGTSSASYKAAAAELDQELQSSRPDKRSERANQRRQIAAAILEVAAEYRLPLQLKKAPKASRNGSGRSGGQRSRMTRAQMQEAVQQVYNALPEKKGEFISKADIAEKVGFDPQSVLLKMKRDGTATTNGMRGPGGAWQRGKKPA